MEQFIDFLDELILSNKSCDYEFHWNGTKISGRKSEQYFELELYKPSGDIDFYFHDEYADLQLLISRFNRYLG